MHCVMNLRAYSVVKKKLVHPALEEIATKLFQMGFVII